MPDRMHVTSLIATTSRCSGCEGRWDVASVDILEQCCGEVAGHGCSEPSPFLCMSGIPAYGRCPLSTDFSSLNSHSHFTA
jgi:hypothetical protein